MKQSILLGCMSLAIIKVRMMFMTSMILTI